MHVGFVLDETGSMMGVKQQTISGFNEYIDTLKHGENSKLVKFTLTKFNSEKVEVVHDSAQLDSVQHLTDETYYPLAMTPLYDAIGCSIRSLECKVDAKANVLIVIQTDGHENASKEFTHDSISSLIAEKKAKGWTFVFLGADQDAWLTSESLGIPKGNSLSYNSSDTRGAFQEVATASVSYAITGGKQTSEFFRDV